MNFVGRVGLEWQVERIGDFTSRCTPGILFQRGDGALMVDDVVSNRVTSSTIAGQLGAGWQLYGIGDTDSVIRNSAGLTADDHIANHQIVSTIPLGQVGPNFHVIAAAQRGKCKAGAMAVTGAKALSLRGRAKGRRRSQSGRPAGPTCITLHTRADYRRCGDLEPRSTERRFNLSR